MIRIRSRKKKPYQNKCIVDFDEIEDYVSVELMDPQDNMRNKRLFERHMNQQEYLFLSSSTRKHRWGARG